MIEEVKQIFDDIRDAIIEMGGDIDVCTSPEDYNEAIKNLAGNNAVLCIPVFKSSQIKPATPTSEISSNNPTNYPEGWGTPDGLTGNIGMSYTIVGPSTTYVSGTEPLLVKGDKESEASWDDATTRTFIICLELPDLDITPYTPVGGTGNVSDNVLVLPIVSELSNGNTTSDGSPNNNHVSGCYTGMSVGTFLAEDGSQVGTGSEPICINGVRDGRNGKDGRNGVDGESQEFIYKRCHNEAEAHTIPTPESANEDDYWPDGGTDSPVGIDSEEYRVEVMCSRKKQSDGTGGPFIGPVIWSSGGEDGMDGDGIEYIYRVVTEQEVTKDPVTGIYHLTGVNTGPPTCAEGCANAFLPVARTGSGYISDEDAIAAYNKDEFIPGGKDVCPDAARLGGDKNGTDDPLDVSRSQPFEFCSIRKYNGESGTWGGFSEPVLGNKYGSNVSPIFTSFAFTRTTKNIGGLELTGGTVSNPVPNTKTFDGETIMGFDTIPNSEDFIDNNLPRTLGFAPVGVATRIFGSTEENASDEDQEWTSPMLMADNRYFNVEYSASDTIDPSVSNFHLPRFDETPQGSEVQQPFIDLNDPEGVNESAGRTYCQTNGLGIGGDAYSSDNPTGIQNPIGMATCTYNAGKGSDGAVTKIKGEKGDKGDKGDDGRGISSTTITYQWSNDGINHPTGGTWSDHITTYYDTTPYLGIKTTITYTGGTTSDSYSVSRQGKDGDQGASGAKMRMRNGSTTYTNPDSEGTSAGLPGNKREGETADPYYDIAIGPVQAQSISIETGSQNADRLWLCIKKLTYSEVANLVSRHGAENVHPGTGGNLDAYFSKAEGGDFIATKVLLADKITANDIDTAQLSVGKLHTRIEDQSDPEDQSNPEAGTLDIIQNIIHLKNASGATRCKISAQDITNDFSTGTQTILATAPGYRFMGGATDANGRYLIDYTVGNFTVITPYESGSVSYDEVKSNTQQQMRFECYGRVRDPDVSEDVFIQGEYELYIRNTDTYEYLGSLTGSMSFGPLSVGNTYNGQTIKYNIGDSPFFNVNTTSNVINSTFIKNPGNYTLYLSLDVGFSDHTGQGGTLNNFYNPEIYLTGPIGHFDPIYIQYAVATSPIEMTEIGGNGFLHGIDGNNYFKIKDDGNGHLILEFLTNGTYGLQISSSGIKYRNGSDGSPGTTP